jgi:hypothetical protein
MRRCILDEVQDMRPDFPIFDKIYDDAEEGEDIWRRPAVNS